MENMHYRFIVKIAGGNRTFYSNCFFFRSSNLRFSFPIPCFSPRYIEFLLLAEFLLRSSLLNRKNEFKRTTTVENRYNRFIVEIFGWNRISYSKISFFAVRNCEFLSPISCFSSTTALKNINANQSHSSIFRNYFRIFIFLFTNSSHSLLHQVTISVLATFSSLFRKSVFTNKADVSFRRTYRQCLSKIGKNMNRKWLSCVRHRHFAPVANQPPVFLLTPGEILRLLFNF